MTRINCIPPEELTDKHLVAEYRELPRIFNLARTGDDIPDSYRLGAGHVKFFYNKLSYCINRLDSLCIEMRRRGFKCNFDAEFYRVLYQQKLMSWDLANDWTPTEEAMQLNRQRIAERLGV